MNEVTLSVYRLYANISPVVATKTLDLKVASTGLRKSQAVLKFLLAAKEGGYLTRRNENEPFWVSFSKTGHFFCAVKITP